MNHLITDTTICPVCNTANQADSVYTHFKTCKQCHHVLHLRDTNPPLVNITTHFDLDYGIFIPGKKINYTQIFTILGRYKLVLKTAYFNICYAETSNGNQLWLAEQNNVLWVLKESPEIRIPSDTNPDVADNIQISRKAYNVVFKQAPECILLDGEVPNLPFLSRNYELWFLRPRSANQLLAFLYAGEKTVVFQLIPFTHE